MNLTYCQDTYIDSTILSIDTASVKGRLYKAIYRTDEFLYIYDSKDSIVFQSKDYCQFFEFKDFNEDGYKDLLINYIGNIPAQHDLILFDDKTDTFKPVRDFSRYPNPIKVGGTRYFYSYHRSGCADMNWDSDLFYIEDFRITKIGTVSGRECDNDNVKDGIYIFKIKRNNNKLFKKLPIVTVYTYKDTKWGFIQAYWNTSYRKFE
jgi:hypothetical protein